MNIYYLVPVGEYEALRSSNTKEPVNKFDQATSSVVNAVGLSEEERAEQLRDLLNKYLNYKSTAQVKFESDLDGIVRKVVGIMDSVPIAASRQAVPVTSVSVPVTALPTPPVTPTVVKPTERIKSRTLPWNLKLQIPRLTRMNFKMQALH